MRTSVFQPVLAVALVGLACKGPDDTSAGATKFHATLTGGAEVPAVNPSGGATATFELNGDQLTYTVTITAPVTDSVRQAHIHLAAAGSNGGISVWLCDSATNPSPDPVTPACALGTSAGVLATGTTTAPAAAVSAMRAFGAYANVHTKTNGGGEIRGQIIPEAP
ncbi:MAG TPA: CHRD domain-containing protein [Gemmatimonadales bacterium]|nr:CHRD domain-containing protein [Gemmatimonadales bacterium]